MGGYTHCIGKIGVKCNGCSNLFIINRCSEVTKEGTRLAAEIMVEILQERPLAKILASGKIEKKFQLVTGGNQDANFFYRSYPCF